MNILFVCVQNAGRSQMAEALFRQATNGRHEARSAGTRPAERVHPEVVEAMREVGVELSDRTPHGLGDEDSGWAEIVVTIGCGDACPYLLGTRYLDWQLPDPAGKGLDEVRAVREEIRLRVGSLLSEL